MKLVWLPYTWISLMRSIGEQPKGSLTLFREQTHGIFYKAKSDLDLIGFTDSDWVGDSIDRNSTLGYVLMLAEGPIECHCTLIYRSRV